MATAPHEAEQSMHTTDMHVCDDVDPEFQTLLEQGLNGFNDMAVGYGDRKPLAVVVTDAQTQRPIGGAAGRTSLGLLFLDLFYLPATLRGRGLGSEVLHTLEAEGKRRGCVSAVLYTISFQAPAFYERHGWKVFGEIPCAPAGTSRIFLTKAL
jgi:GNAT superfamily N-acetyltransferase